MIRDSRVVPGRVYQHSRAMLLCRYKLNPSIGVGFVEPPSLATLAIGSYCGMHSTYSGIGLGTITTHTEAVLLWLKSMHTAVDQGISTRGSRVCLFVCLLACLLMNGEPPIHNESTYEFLVP